ncbi:NAD-dependent epimerase/dehydratase family protein [Brevibacillus laterosporus]|uniref:NAD-dependent epimerase/dehydratase family protein n=1 Tax=Brevibacillus laterosporus TaxID=1465 RepID=UPI001444562F|nr:NAD-dependent epimerase/dehydratase family protein [Brevibacillus laterosporus]NKQ20361.1 NAD-dependent epimerase/dehydratase family protein [Brevibacillus laterosporus]WNX31007.1 NAD-dependent epimerase/dehydratase family protein [Brevibacillus laterosporus]
MNKALVFGATGSIGTELVLELLRNGIHTVAFARSDKKLTKLQAEWELEAKELDYSPTLSLYTGDAYCLEDVLQAATGVDVIFHCVSVPYPEWKTGHPVLMHNVLTAAKHHGVKVVVIDNIYAYGRAKTPLVNEQHSKEPHTSKGKIRLQMEQLVWKAHESGTPCMLVHLPDFYGPHATNTFLHVTLESMAKGKPSIFIGDTTIKREYIYTPDAAQAIVQLAKRPNTYGTTWNIPGAGTISAQQIREIARLYNGRNNFILPIGRKLMTVLGWFQPFMREMVEMMYVTESTIQLDGSKYERELGRIVHTPYEQGIMECLKRLS